MLNLTPCQIELGKPRIPLENEVLSINGCNSTRQYQNFVTFKMLRKFYKHKQVEVLLKFLQNFKCLPLHFMRKKGTSFLRFPSTSQNNFHISLAFTVKEGRLFADHHAKI